MRRMSVCTTTPATSSGVSVVRVALDADIPEAVGGSPRLEYLARDAGRGHLVHLARRQRLREERPAARCSVVTSPRHRAARRASGCASCRPDRGSQPDPAVDVLAEIDHLAPVSSRVTETGTISSTRRTGGAGESTSRRSRVDDHDRRPSRVVETRSVQPRGNRVGPPARRRSGRPRRRGPSALRQCGPVPNTVRVPSSSVISSWASNASSVPHWSAARVIPIWPRNQPSARITADRVPARPQVAGHVEGLHRHVVVVLGEPRGQFVVADPLAVEVRLVQAVRGDVHPGRGDRPVDVELGPEQRRRRSPGSARVLPARPRTACQSWPSSSPISNQAHSDHSTHAQSVHTWTCHLHPLRRGRAAAPRTAPGCSGRSRPGRCPSHCWSGPVRGLPGGAGGQSPGEPRLADVDAQGLVEVLDPQVARGDHGFSRCCRNAWVRSSAWFATSGAPRHMWSAPG